MKVKIRIAQKYDSQWIAEHGNACTELWNSNVSGWYQIKEVEDVIKNQPKHCFLIVAEIDQKLVGFALVHNLLSYSLCTGLYIQERYRSKGIGKQLLKEAEVILKSLGIHSLHLLVESKNSKALRFYQDNGFYQGHEFFWMDKTITE